MTGEEPASTPGWCTNWQAFNTPRLWAMVADEDNAESWKQIAALGTMADTLKEQVNRLVAARDALVQAWPPETNPGAQVFLRRLNTLLANMADTKAKADENAVQLGHVVDTLRQAKAKIEPLYQQYLDKSDDLVPNWWDHAEDELDGQARQHMIDTEQAVAPRAEKITAPAPYTLNLDGYVDSSESGMPTSGSSPRHGSVSGSNSVSGASVSVPHEPPPPLPGHDPVLPATPTPGTSTGPGLAGMSPIPPGTPAAAPPSPSPAMGPPSGPIGPGLIIGGGGASWPGGGGGSRGVLSRPIGGPPAGRGVYSGAKPVTPSWLPAGSSQPGVLGAAGQPGRGNSGRPTSRGQLVGGPGVHGERQQHRERDDQGIQFDPDNPWATATGVTPVIEPSKRQPRHDPGPGVIGRHE